jgi:hypothetical protein
MNSHFTASVLVAVVLITLMSALAAGYVVLVDGPQMPGIVSSYVERLIGIHDRSWGHYYSTRSLVVRRQKVGVRDRWAQQEARSLRPIPTLYRRQRPARVRLGPAQTARARPRGAGLCLPGGRRWPPRAVKVSRSCA